MSDDLRVMLSRHRRAQLRRRAAKELKSLALVVLVFLLVTFGGGFVAHTIVSNVLDGWRWAG